MSRGGMDTATQMNPEKKDRLPEIRDRIARMGGELEVQAQLGKMELRDYLAENKPKLENIRRELESMTGTVRDELQLGLSKLEAKVEHFEERYLKS